MDAPRYPKHVFWSDDDEGFIAVAPDLPGSSAFGETEAEALAELDQAIDAWIEAARAAGNGVPAPSRPASPSLPSGKVLVRMPRTLHQSLTREADREDVSLNQFMVYVLSRYSEVVAPQRLTAVPTITGGSWEGATGTVTITAGTVRTLKGFGSTGHGSTSQEPWHEIQARNFRIYGEAIAEAALSIDTMFVNY
jgi:predicted RNase H-like HicB family nuclease